MMKSCYRKFAKVNTAKVLWLLWLLVVVIIFCQIVPNSNAWAEANAVSVEKPMSPEQKFQLAIEEYSRGNVKKAYSLIKPLAELNPENARIQQYHALIKNSLTKLNAKKGLENSLSKVIIPKIDFQQTSLSEALAYLKAKTKEVSKGKVTFNYIFLEPELSKNEVTLKLTKTPVNIILRYLLQVSKVKYKYQKNAIVIYQFGLDTTATTQEFKTNVEN